MINFGLIENQYQRDSIPIENLKDSRRLVHLLLGFCRAGAVRTREQIYGSLRKVDVPERDLDSVLRRAQAEGIYYGVYDGVLFRGPRFDEKTGEQTYFILHIGRVGRTIALARSMRGKD